MGAYFEPQILQNQSLPGTSDKKEQEQTLDLTQQGTTYVFFIACYSSSNIDFDTSPEPNDGLVLHGIDGGGRVYIWWGGMETRCPYQALYKAKHISIT